MNRPIGFDTISANDCAEGALRDLGRYDRSCAHWKHDFLAWVMTIFPKFIGDKISTFTFLKEMEKRKMAHEKSD